jgi:hypothetical protein
MNVEQLSTQLSSNAQRIRVLVEGVSRELARWKPGLDSWSILEVINHLYDEEVEDFPRRLDVILNQPDQVWTPIDPEGWVTERQYNQRELGASLTNFLQAREKSLAWLEGLESPDWNAVYKAPFGQIRAGDMLAAWAAHDLLHMRQLIELHRAYTVRLVRPYSVDYAGPW